MTVMKKKKNSSSWQSFVLGCLKVDDDCNNRSSNRKKIPSAPAKQISFHNSNNRVSVSDLSSSTTLSLSEDISNSLAGSNLHIFTLQELKVITQNFSTSNFLGEGGFGPVHKGFIDDKLRPGLKAQPVAVKLLDLDGSQGHMEWLTEVIFLGQLRHPNLVKLIGYCCEDEHRLLVYEYMPRGSLENQLFRRYSVSLPWSTRMKIAFGAAKGLEFLHEAEKPVIYRDFKASNILLDSDYTAKLSDFGLAKDGPEGDDTHVSTRVMGTHGYAAPEYVMTGHLTAASDVYSFGVVLLELLTGRRSVDKTRPHREQNLADWARPMLKEPRKLSRIMDPRLEGQYSETGAQKAASLAYHCLSHRPKNRPTMSNIVKTLEPLKDFNDIPIGTFVYTVSPPPTPPPAAAATPPRVESSDPEGNKYEEKDNSGDKNNNGPYHHKHRLHNYQDQRNQKNSKIHRIRTSKSQTVFSETHLQQALRHEMKSPGHHRLKRS